MKNPLFLTLAEVVEIQKDQIKRYGGDPGVRDIRLLESAVFQAQASFGEQWLHKDIFEMAAAYAYHICQNHPFVDANKRTALAAALMFLELNGISLLDPKGQLADAMFKVAKGELTKTQLTNIFQQLPNE